MENNPAERPLTAPPAPLKRRHAFIIGFIALFPLMLTVLVLSLFWGMIVSVSEPVVRLVTWIVANTIRIETPPQWMGSVVALLLAVIVIYLMGLAVEKLFGDQVVRLIDAIGVRLPVVRHIYPYAKQLADFLWGAHKLNFSRVVAIEYPRKGTWSLGFMTSGGIPAASSKLEQTLVAVFVPTSPTPFTGWTILVPEAEVKTMDMTVDEAVRFIVSCGVIVPGQPVAAPPTASTQN